MSPVSRLRRPATTPGAILALALLGLAVLGLGAGLVRPHAAAAAAQRLIGHVRDMGEAGIGLFVLAQVAIALSGVLPAALLGVAAGALYGLAWGFALAAASTLAGALAAFLLARSMLREAVERRLRNHPRLAQLDALVAQDGWRIVGLLRVSPVMPFSVTSYALGLTSIPVRDYMAGTLASLPALLGYVLLGSLAEAELEAWTRGGTGVFHAALLAAGMLATAALTLRLGWLAKRAGLLKSRGPRARGAAPADGPGAAAPGGPPAEGRAAGG